MVKEASSKRLKASGPGIKAFFPVKKPISNEPAASSRESTQSIASNITKQDKAPFKSTKKKVPSRANTKTDRGNGAAERGNAPKVASVEQSWQAYDRYEIHRYVL